MRIIILFSVLLISWWVFSGYTEAFFIVSGIISCAVAVFFSVRMDIVDHEEYPLFLKPGFLSYSAWLVREIIVSSIDVTRKVWHIKSKISPVIGWLPASQGSDVGKAVYASSITLTPGTVCTDLKHGKVQVHALTKNTLKTLRKGEMDAKVTGAVE